MHLISDLILLVSALATVAARDFYIAAVYEHGSEVAIPNNATSNRTEALKIMNKNMDVLENQAELAAKQVRDYANCHEFLYYFCILHIFYEIMYYFFAVNRPRCVYDLVNSAYHFAYQSWVTRFLNVSIFLYTNLLKTL